MAIFRVPVELQVVKAGFQLGFHIISNVRGLPAVIFQVLVCQLHRFGQAEDSVDILRPPAHIALLCAAVYVGFDDVVSVDIDEPYSFGPVKLMRRPGEKADGRFRNINGVIAYSLNRIGVKQRAVFPAQFSYFLQVDHSAHLIVGVHKGHHGFLRTAFQ